MSDDNKTQNCVDDCECHEHQDNSSIGNQFSMEQMTDFIAFNVNEKGREMVQKLNEVKQGLKDTTKEILKEKIAIKKVERGGNKVDYSKIGDLEKQYNTLLGEHNKLVQTLHAQRQSLAMEGMQAIQKVEADNQEKASKAQKKRDKRKRKRERKKAAQSN